MTAPAITLTAGEAEAAEAASAVLTRILARDFPWEYAARAEIKQYLAGLSESLDDFNGLRDDTVHPATLFFDLAAGHPDGALGDALDQVTQDIRDWTGALENLADAAEEAARAREEGSEQDAA